MQCKHLLPKLYEVDLGQQTKKFKVRNQLMAHTWYDQNLILLTRYFGDVRNIEKQRDVSHKLYLEQYDQQLTQLERKQCSIQSNSTSFKIIGQGQSQFVISDDSIFSIINEKQKLVVDQNLIGASFLHSATVCPFGRFILVSFDMFLAIIRINEDGLEIGSKLATQPLKSICHVEDDIYVGLTQIFNDDENQDSQIKLLFFKATRMGLEYIKEKDYIGDFCASIDNLDINLQHNLIKSNEIVINMEKIVIYSSFGRYQCSVQQPELQGKYMPCVACLDVTESPFINYSISSFGVPIAMNISPFMFKNGEDFHELVAFADSFGYFNITFGTCRLSDHRIFSVNTKMAIKQIKFGVTTNQDQEMIEIFTLDSEENPVSQKINRFCQISLLGETDVPYQDEELKRLLFAKQNYSLLSIIQVDLLSFQQILLTQVNVVEEATINNEQVAEFSNYNYEIVQIDEDSHVSCDEDTQTSIFQAMQLLNDEVVKRLIDPTYAPKEDEYEDVTNQTSLTSGQLAKSVAKLTGTQQLSQQKQQQQPQQQIVQQIVQYISPQEINCPTSLQLKNEKTIEFTKLLQQTDDSSYIVKLGQEFIIVGGQPSVAIISSKSLILGTANGLLYFLDQSPLHLISNPILLDSAVLGIAIQNELTNELQINEVQLDSIDDFYAITQTNVYYIKDQSIVWQIQTQQKYQGYIAISTGVCCVSSQVSVIQKDHQFTFPVQALISLGGDMQIINSIMSQSIIPKTVIKSLFNSKDLSQINHKVYDILQSDDDIKKVLFSSTVQMILNWAYIEYKYFGNKQIMIDCLNWSSSITDKQFFALVVQYIDSDINDEVQEFLRQYFKNQ
ncbi:hypothetical protein SS50377_20087 [Spironucleus salmonicida]|uniref:Uncharacterized protein n=1 Tax=Spironucleus salmonicida TaxID=348837 RepID=V6M7D1_9EUKA|nr:hypothetical protein SS50377_20087 [Spironucleus salmonicida]|eukprot:EST49344.1 Hypothetical protein SS50377_10269 [Spironucleus salmonicida]